MQPRWSHQVGKVLCVELRELRHAGHRDRFQQCCVFLSQLREGPNRVGQRLQAVRSGCMGQFKMQECMARVQRLPNSGRCILLLMPTWGVNSAILLHAAAETAAITAPGWWPSLAYDSTWHIAYSHQVAGQRYTCPHAHSQQAQLDTKVPGWRCSDW